MKLRGNMTQGFQRVKNICILMGIYMQNQWKPLQVHNIFSIYNNISTTTIINTIRSIGYWIQDEGSGTTTFF
jgi:hypothetical protein